MKLKPIDKWFGAKRGAEVALPAEGRREGHVLLRPSGAAEVDVGALLRTPPARQQIAAAQRLFRRALDERRLVRRPLPAPG
jgi:hypothetical protein